MAELHSPDSEPTVLCCNGKRCPQIQENHAENSFVLSDPSVGPDQIRLTREQAALLHAYLGERLGT